MTSNKIIIGFVFVLFLFLKLSGAVDWSWLVVLSPILLPVAVFILAIVLNFIFQKWRT